MKCFLLSQDLMFTSQARGAAESAECEPVTIANADEAISLLTSAERDMPGASGIAVIDLTAAELDIQPTIELLKRHDIRVIAIGPHVHEAKLEAAKSADCDYVLTKGQASRELPVFIEKIASQNSM